MKKHIVTCVKCGRQFDANEGGAYYPESRRYVCKHCVDKQKDIQKEQAKARKAAEREAEADERERVTGMRQSKIAMLVKIVVGVCSCSPPSRSPYKGISPLSCAGSLSAARWSHGDSSRI